VHFRDEPKTLKHAYRPYANPLWGRTERMFQRETREKILTKYVVGAKANPPKNPSNAPKKGMLSATKHVKAATAQEDPCLAEEHSLLVLFWGEGGLFQGCFWRVFQRFFTGFGRVFSGC
jgi:hypothetical protein